MVGTGFGRFGVSYAYGAVAKPGEVHDYEPGTVKMGDAYFDDEAGEWYDAIHRYKWYEELDSIPRTPSIRWLDLILRNGERGN